MLALFIVSDLLLLLVFVLRIAVFSFASFGYSALVVPGDGFSTELVVEAGYYDAVGAPSQGAGEHGFHGFHGCGCGRGGGFRDSEYNGGCSVV